MTSRLLPVLALILLVGVCASVALKVRIDEAAFTAERARAVGPSPAPSMPAGLDGRALDPTLPSMPERAPPDQRHAQPPGGPQSRPPDPSKRPRP